VSLDGRPLEVNSHLKDETDSAKDLGWITSAAWSDRLGKQIALGYVKRGANGIGTRLLAGDYPVQIVPLPFT
jgi:glycine cleavage system aminomethyltransferase T